MPLILSGTAGVSQVNGTAAAPAITGTDTDTGIFFPAANTLAFSTNGTEDARFDSSGNLGLGVTPSAWSASFKAIQLGTKGAFYGSTSATVIADNVYNDGSAKYLTTAAAGNYVQSGGTHYWQIAGSGTAGNAITFTQAMTLDASGNLGVGTTSPTQHFEISGTSNQYLSSISTNGGNAGIRMNSSGNRDFGIFSDGAMRFYDFTAAAERARIDSSGNLLINATSPTFASGGTTYTVKFAVDATNQTNGAYFKYNSTGAFVTLNNTFGSGTRPYISFDNGNTRAGDVSYNGSVMTYGGTSDYRLKENVQPIQNGLSRVMQMNPVSYTWKHNGMASEGFLAHEIQAISPDAVSGEKDAVDQNGNPQYQQVDPRQLVCILTAAIQEQQAIITQLQADVAALKGNA